MSERPEVTPSSFITPPKVYGKMRDGATISLLRENWRLLRDLADIHPCFIEHMKKAYSGGYASFRTYAADGSLEAFRRVPSFPTAPRSSNNLQISH